MNDEHPTTFVTSSQYIVKPVPTVPAVIIPRSDWVRLRKKVNRLNSTLSRFVVAASTFTGAGLSTIVTGILDWSSEEPRFGNVVWILASALAVCAVVCWISVYREHRQSATNKDDVIDEMDHIESNHNLQDPS
jgi:hypothetical protein